MKGRSKISCGKIKKNDLNELQILLNLVWQKDHTEETWRTYVMYTVEMLGLE